MPTFFELNSSFAEVPISSSGGISTVPFLDAAEDLVKIFDLLGNKAFNLVQADLRNNINKIRARLATNSGTSSTLQELVNNEHAVGEKTASEALLWLNRDLHFTARAMRETIDNPNLELTTTFTDAYNKTLISYHGILVRSVFKLAMKACPPRRHFFLKLGDDQTRVNSQLEEWLLSLEEVVDTLLSFMKDMSDGKS